MFLFLLLAVISVTAFCVNDTVTSNEVVVNLTGNSLKGFLINNWAAFASIILVLIWECFLGETSKIKENSTIKLIYSWVISFLKKKAGKAMVIAAVFGFSVLGSNAINAQSSPWSGFLKPVSENSHLKLSKYSLTATDSTYISTTTGTWLFRPSLSLTAVLVDLKTKEIETLTSVGTGLSYGNYTTSSSGTAYCSYSFNASLLTQVSISGTTTANFGGAISADVFNKTIGLLIGYLGTSGFADGHIVIGTSFSYSF